MAMTKCAMTIAAIFKMATDREATFKVLVRDRGQG